MSHSMTDAQAKFYWSDPNEAELRDFVLKHQGRPLEHFKSQKLKAAIHIMRQKGIALTPQTAQTQAAPASGQTAPAAPGVGPGATTAPSAGAAHPNHGQALLQAVQLLAQQLQGPAGASAAATILTGLAKNPQFQASLNATPGTPASAPPPTPGPASAGAPPMPALNQTQILAMLGAAQKLAAGSPLASVLTGDPAVDAVLTTMQAAPATGQPAPGTAPAAGPAVSGTPGAQAPSLRPLPPHLPPFTDTAAAFYWNGADDATMKAFVDGKAAGSLTHFEERKYHAAVHLLKKNGALASATGAGGQGYVFEIATNALDPSIQSTGMRCVLVAQAADVKAGRLSAGDHPAALEQLLENNGFYRAMEWTFEIDDGMDDAQATQVLTSLGLVPFPGLTNLI